MATDAEISEMVERLKTLVLPGDDKTLHYVIAAWFEPFEYPMKEEIEAADRAADKAVLAIARAALGAN